MPYLQLSSRPLPGTAGRDVVFPFLRQTPHDSSVPDGPADSHFALRVAEANTHARAVLALLGFEGDATTTPTGGPGSDWRFHWCSTGPFRPLSDDAADPHARL